MSGGVGGSRYCNVCGNLTGFFVWTSSRNFPINKMCKVTGEEFNKDTIKKYKSGHVVCFDCYDKIKSEE